MIASDGFIEHGRGHPRTSGTFAKVLGKYVREEKAVPLMDALRRMTIEPARRLERRTPAMSAKGRIRVGADADLTIFDPATVIDRATYEDASIPSAGIPYVIVGGQAVVDGGQITSARPGRAIRAPIQAGRPYVISCSARRSGSTAGSARPRSVRYGGPFAASASRRCQLHLRASA